MQKVILIILDGYGLREESAYNAVSAADKPTLDELFSKYPNTKLRCSGLDVGLPDGLMGNSEVGHLNIGAGRIVKQLLVKINKSIADGTFRQNNVFKEIIGVTKSRGSALHLIGLVSEGRVHSSLEHLYELLKMAKEYQLRKVFIHAFTDGRDTSPKSGLKYLSELEEKIDEIGVGVIATISGRYYAMDRDKRWDRTEEAYRAMVYGEGEKYSSYEETLKNSYEKGITDEFIIPSTLFNDGKPIGSIDNGDSLIAFNYRADRMRQITRALTDQHFHKFENGSLKMNYASMAMYEESNKLPYAFELEKLDNILGEIVSNSGSSQLRVAETEKYAHVTYFFNGGIEQPFQNEERQLVNSPRAATYDLQPEMSAEQVTDTAYYAIQDDEYDLIILNYANCDMVGHTGSFDAAVAAVETVDKGLSKIVPAMIEMGGVCLITADHGNAELMFDETTGLPHTAHTTSLVPFILAGVNYQVKLQREGRLADIAPTILDLLKIEQPEEMTGSSLIENIKLTSTVENEESVLDGL
ncbi:MAG: 2,3-bisphosphoglycerate-independent phosphoglycerate mutase [Candidatus Marinimicrobia bacterium]|nr:2,3-bisphosphoglycerate-independent phosphoglycerate mutase [Candidatus Neomarinimicrobiota bacterium]